MSQIDESLEPMSLDVLYGGVVDNIRIEQSGIPRDYHIPLAAVRAMQAKGLDTPDAIMPGLGDQIRASLDHNGNCAECVGCGFSLGEYAPGEILCGACENTYGESAG